MATIRITASGGGITQGDVFEGVDLMVNGQPRNKEVTITVDEDGVTIDSGTIIIPKLGAAELIFDCLKKAAREARKKAPRKPAKPKTASRRR
jgi:hypothetical protein